MKKTDRKEKDSAKNEKKEIKIPEVKQLSDSEKIEIYKEELLKKDKRIEDLERENKLLLDLTMKNAKRRLEELEQKTK
ncbi:MAG: hypothetical protein ACP5N3_05880 [Candidatus Nanoarchaeia archaeon]